MKTIRRRIRTNSWLIMGLGMTGLLTSCADHNSVTRAAATVNLVNTSGNSIGTANLTENSSGTVTLDVKVNGLPAGSHGIHFHEVGVADPKASPAFSTSGEHYNPASKKHGISNPQGTHAGDLANLEVDAQGNGRLTTTTDRITLTEGATTLFDANGSSLIIHANTDDQVTDPSGNSGGRIAGGVVVKQ
ncbi:superoxide dismutase family protein [Spirosoma sp. KUDC1026]|uniref:superoxide dismutase family protein n=1 Tax=Spirosoma sp. KUDC1026 TaxID=2745947 RepID=UPI00159B9ABE|nr:superoxide dismutase family protein [Spirosoma sp. KUDC1026]QKZ13793.1 superoxide dismutase family protein [Spirosoma sp. KUDC1026]